MNASENTNNPAHLNTVREVTLTYGRTFAPLSAPVSSPAFAVDLFRSMVATNATREHFCAAYLDSKNRVIGAGIISIGTLNASLVHPREVLAPAVHLLAQAVIVGHNHPSGDVTPSRDDDTITARLAAAGDVLGIRVLDHVVFDAAADRDAIFYSYAESCPRLLAPPANPPAGSDTQGASINGATIGGGRITAREDGPAYRRGGTVNWLKIESGIRDVLSKLRGDVLRTVPDLLSRGIQTDRAVRNTYGRFAPAALQAISDILGDETGRGYVLDLFADLEAMTSRNGGGASTAREDGPAYGASPRCECSDPGCPVHAGGSCQAGASQVLARIDMGGAVVSMCDACAEDAQGSGLFANVPDTTEEPAPLADVDDARRLINATRKIKNFAYHGGLDLGGTWAFAGIGDTHRDADTVTRSNHRVIYRDLLARFPDDVEIVHTSHFACGWYDHLAVRVLETEDGSDVRPILSAVLEWTRALENYSAASDDDLSEIESEEIEGAITSYSGTEAVEEFLKDRDGDGADRHWPESETFRAVYGERVDDVLRERAEHNGTDVRFILRSGDLDFVPPVTDPDCIDTMREDGNDEGAEHAEESMRAWARRETLAGIEATRAAGPVGMTFAGAAAAYVIPAWYFGPYRETAAALKNFESTPDLFLLTVDHPAGGYSADPGASTAREDGPEYVAGPNVDAPAAAARGPACPACGGENDFWGRVDGGPCMPCVRARAKAAQNGGRCKCGRQARPREVRTRVRCWVACDRCLGTIRQLPDAPRGGASTVREDVPDYGAPADLRNEDDPAVWNPRYVLFARYHGRGPSAQRRADRKENGAAVNLGFMIWISGMMFRFGREQPSATRNGYAYDPAAWDAFLLRETTQREALRSTFEASSGGILPLVDLRPGDRIRILGQRVDVDVNFAARWKLRGETTVPFYAVILAGAPLRKHHREDNEDARGGASTVREDGPDYGAPARRPWQIGDRVQLWQPGFPSGTVTRVTPAGSVLVCWDDEEAAYLRRFGLVGAGELKDGDPAGTDPPKEPGPWQTLSIKEDAMRRAIRLLRDARDALRSVHADRAAAAVCRALKSTEGAIRHAQGVASRTARKQGGATSTGRRCIGCDTGTVPPDQGSDYCDVCRAEEETQAPRPGHRFNEHGKSVPS